MSSSVWERSHALANIASTRRTVAQCKHIVTPSKAGRLAFVGAVWALGDLEALMSASSRLRKTSQRRQQCSCLVSRFLFRDKLDRLDIDVSDAFTDSRPSRFIPRNVVEA